MRSTGCCRSTISTQAPMPSRRRMSKRSWHSARRAFASSDFPRVPSRGRLQPGLPAPAGKPAPGSANLSEGPTAELPMQKGIGSDSGRIRRMPFLGRAVRRPELGALSGAVLIYVVFFAVARSSGMFSLEGLINILSVSAEIGIIAAAATLLMIAGEFDLSIGSMIGFAGIVIGLATTE